MVEPPSFETLIGTTLGNYRLEQLIEPGDVAPVFLASGSSAGAMYRLRILPVPADLSSEQRIVYLGRFQQEANSVSALHHPSIQPLLDYGNANGMPYLVSAHSPMKPLNTELAQKPMATPIRSDAADQTNPPPGTRSPLTEYNSGTASPAGGST